MNDEFQQIFRAMQTTVVEGRSVNDIVGGGNPRIIGQELVDYVCSTGPLTPTTRIFEVGCGCGRTAPMLAAGLSPPEGVYVGVDIIPSLVEFCIDAIEPACPAARFYLSGDQNPQYNDLIAADRQSFHRVVERGRITDRDFRTLREATGSQAFDLVLAFSVFTHLQPDEAAAMLARLEGLLGERGRAILSFFLLDEGADEAIESGSAAYFGAMPAEMRAGDWVMDETNGPNGAVAYRLPFLRRLLGAAGLTITGIEFGRWRRGSGRVFQDMVVVSRTPQLPADFDPERYLSLHEDVRRGGLSAGFHYLAYGLAEGRRYR